MVVTASRIEEPRSEVSSFVQVITQERIELSSAQDLGDLFTQAGLGNDYDAKGYGRIKNTSWDAESLSAKLGFEPKRGHDLLLSLQYVKGWKIGSPGARYSPSLTDYRYVRSYPMPERTLRAGLSFKF